VIRQELLNATDEEIENALQHVNPMILRGILYQLVGDESIAAISTAMVSIGFRGEAPAIVDAEDIAFLRTKAANLLRLYRDTGANTCHLGPESRLHRSMELTVGCEIREAELPMWKEQLALDPMIRGVVLREAPSEGRLRQFSVAVVGAGMGGLNAAVHLKRAGIPFTVFEKNGEVGGTWHENRYPGARVDSPSRIYFHAYGVDFPCPNAYCPQGVNERYFNWVADRFDLRRNIEFNTEVTSIVWDSRDLLWKISATTVDGLRTWTVNAVISSVGFLNRPQIPQIPGKEKFRGPAFHTSRWPNPLDFAGKRVAVIGSGATGYQMAPELAKTAAHLTLFQRTPSWCLEVPGYLAEYVPEVNWLDRNFPYLANFTRFYTSWQTRPDVLTPTIDVDPNHNDPHSVSAENQKMRRNCLDFLARKLGDRPDLLVKMTPDLPPMTSRPILVDPEYCIYDVIKRDDVTLCTDAIEEITATGLRTSDGTQHEFDILVYATGFKASEYLWPMTIIGRDGASIDKLWQKDGARAYLGTMLPGFPNFFMLYGPNTNPFGTGLGVVDSVEMTTRFALKCIEHLLVENRSYVDVLRAAYDRYNRELDRVQAKKVYSDTRVANYYRNRYGRSAAMEVAKRSFGESR
jgi:4-hydroxyacetophenone monooxygenase